jgi:hypothetical protein
VNDLIFHYVTDMKEVIRIALTRQNVKDAIVFDEGGSSNGKASKNENGRVPGGKTKERKKIAARPR